LEFETKKERKHYFRDVLNICVEGRVKRTRWSHIPITFSEEDVKLQGFSQQCLGDRSKHSKLDFGEAFG
jgi:hypothetical protein